MKRRLMIEGNAVYEIDEECMLAKRIDDEREEQKLVCQELSESMEKNKGKRGQKRNCS